MEISVGWLGLAAVEEAVEAVVVLVGCGAGGSDEEGVMPLCRAGWLWNSRCLPSFEDRARSDRRVVVSCLGNCRADALRISRIDSMVQTTEVMFLTGVRVEFGATAIGLVTSTLPEGGTDWFLLEVEPADRQLMD